MIVMCITGWDGQRVLGIFTDEETALKELESVGIPYDEKISLDFVEIDKISNTLSIEPSINLPIKRIHIYDDEQMSERGVQ